MFTISPPSHSFRWNDIIYLLLRARRDSSSPLSRQILFDVINRQLPAWIRKHKSFTLLYGIGRTTHHESHQFWEHGIELFTHLDKIMVEMCRDPEDAEGLDEESVKRWRKLRLAYTQRIRDGDDIPWWVAPEHLQLPDSYFDDLLGHGPLSALLTPHRHPSSSVALAADLLDDPLTA